MPEIRFTANDEARIESALTALREEIETAFQTLSYKLDEDDFAFLRRWIPEICEAQARSYIIFEEVAESAREAGFGEDKDYEDFTAKAGDAFWPMFCTTNEPRWMALIERFNNPPEVEQRMYEIVHETFINQSPAGTTEAKVRAEGLGDFWGAHPMWDAWETVHGHFWERFEQEGSRV